MFNNATHRHSTYLGLKNEDKYVTLEHTNREKVINISTEYIN